MAPHLTLSPRFAQPGTPPHSRPLSLVHIGKRRATTRQSTLRLHPECFVQREALDRRTRCFVWNSRTSVERATVPTPNCVLCAWCACLWVCFADAGFILPVLTPIPSRSDGGPAPSALFPLQQPARTGSLAASDLAALPDPCLTASAFLAACASQSTVVFLSCSALPAALVPAPRPTCAACPPPGSWPRPPHSLHLRPSHPPASLSTRATLSEPLQPTRGPARCAPYTTAQQRRRRAPAHHSVIRSTSCLYLLLPGIDSAAARRHCTSTARTPRIPAWRRVRHSRDLRRCSV